LAKAKQPAESTNKESKEHQFYFQGSGCVQCVFTFIYDRVCLNELRILNLISLCDLQVIVAPLEPTTGWSRLQRSRRLPVVTDGSSQPRAAADAFHDHVPE
jgi:hypothetical protein